MESVLKRKATKRLESWGWLVVHYIQTSLNGWPDTQIMRNGVSVYIEWKDLGKNPRELQLFRHKQIREAGAQVFVIDKIEDIEKFK